MINAPTPFITPVNAFVYAVDTEPTYNAKSKTKFTETQVPSLAKPVYSHVKRIRLAKQVCILERLRDANRTPFQKVRDNAACPDASLCTHAEDK